MKIASLYKFGYCLLNVCMFECLYVHLSITLSPLQYPAALPLFFNFFSLQYLPNSHPPFLSFALCNFLFIPL